MYDRNRAGCCILLMLAAGVGAISARSAWAVDCDTNGVSDACDISCGVSGGPCDVPGCGLAGDCNTNGVPDECEPDGDSDGVPDLCDGCPGTVPGASVDSGGCPPVIPGDFDRDGDVDLGNFDHFQECPSGPTIQQTDALCRDADLDGDGDVDVLDFSVFQRCYSGFDNPADPLCGRCPNRCDPACPGYDRCDPGCPGYDPCNPMCPGNDQ